jgi:hypothetical protein
VWIILPIYWGALWKTNTGVHNLNGWIVVRFSHELAIHTHGRHVHDPHTCFFMLLGL